MNGEKTSYASVATGIPQSVASITEHLFLLSGFPETRESTF